VDGIQVQLDTNSDTDCAPLYMQPLGQSQDAHGSGLSTPHGWGSFQVPGSPACMESLFDNSLAGGSTPSRGSSAATLTRSPLRPMAHAQAGGLPEHVQVFRAAMGVNGVEGQGQNAQNLSRPPSGGFGDPHRTATDRISVDGGDGGTVQSVVSTGEDYLLCP